MIKRVYIEITNKCNLRCSFCAFNHRSPLEISPCKFETILKQVKPITSYIYLHVQGEPLLHSSFNDILALCDRYEMKVQLVTNGLLLSQYKDMHLHPSIRKISISLHSIDEQKTDEKAYINNIIQFIEFNKGSFYIECRFWIMNKLKSKALYCLNTLKETYPFDLKKKADSYKMTFNTYVMFAKEFEWPSSISSLTDEGTCLGAKTMLAILSNGNVTICCLDAEGAINLGNIYETSLNDILKSSHYQEIIKGFQNHKCVETLCKQCTYKNRFN